MKANQPLSRTTKTNSETSAGNQKGGGVVANSTSTGVGSDSSNSEEDGTLTGIIQIYCSQWEKSNLYLCFLCVV